MPTCQHELIGVPAPAYLPTLVGIGSARAPVCPVCTPQWSAGLPAATPVDLACDSKMERPIRLIGTVSSSWEESLRPLVGPGPFHAPCAKSRRSPIVFVHPHISPQWPSSMKVGLGVMSGEVGAGVGQAVGNGEGAKVGKGVGTAVGAKVGPSLGMMHCWHCSHASYAKTPTEPHW